MTLAGFDPGAHRASVVQPPRRPGRGEPDRGLCTDECGGEHELVSGHGDRLADLALRRLWELGYVDHRHVPEIAAHVEMKAALWMREHQAPHTKLILGGAPCVGPLSCDTVLSGVPPAWTRQPIDHAADPTLVAYWRHEHSQRPAVARTRADVDDLIDRLLAEPFDHSVAALYVVQRPLNRVGLPDHELRIAVDAAADLGGLRYMGGPGTWYSAGAGSRYEHVCYHHMGWAAPFPRDSELPVHRLCAAVHEFLTTGGGRPTCVDWQPAMTT